MIRQWRPHCIATGLCLLAGAAFGQEEAAETPAKASEVTVVTSDKLTYDAKKKFALFEKNVVVTDPQLQLTSDKLTLYFDDAGEAKTILAEGQVRINQADKKSTSQKATYDVPSGKIVLEGKPRVNQGKDILEGDTITFWRNQNRMECFPRARLVMFPSEGGKRNKIAGE